MGNCTYYPRTKKNSQIILKSHRDEATQRNNPEEFLSNNDFDAQSQETSNNTLKEDILSITKTNDTSHSSIKFTFIADSEPTLLPIALQANQTIVFEVSGQWSFYPDYGKRDFKGYTNIMYNNINTGQLMGRVLGGSPFVISKSKFSYTSEVSGQLMLYPNGDMISVNPEGELYISIEGQCLTNSINDKASWNGIRTNEQFSNILSKEELELIELINKVRVNPSLFATQYIDKANQDNSELFTFLMNYTPVGEVTTNISLCEAAQSHNIDIGKKGLNGHISSDTKSGIGERVRKYSNKQIKYYGENLLFGKRKAYSILIAMLKGSTRNDRSNRYNILNEEYTHIGVSIRPHIAFKYGCVIVFGRQLE